MATKADTLKAKAQALVERLPEDVAWDDEAYEIAVRRSIKRGLVDLDAGCVYRSEALLESLGQTKPGLFMTRPTATTPGPASATFRSVAHPHRSDGYASGALGRGTPHLRDLEPSRYVRVMNSPG